MKPTNKVKSFKLREADNFSAECQDDLCHAVWSCDDYREFDEVRAEVVKHIEETGHRVVTKVCHHNLIKLRPGA